MNEGLLASYKKLLKPLLFKGFVLCLVYQVIIYFMFVVIVPSKSLYVVSNVILSIFLYSLLFILRGGNLKMKWLFRFGFSREQYFQTLVDASATRLQYYFICFILCLSVQVMFFWLGVGFWELDQFISAEVFGWIPIIKFVYFYLFLNFLFELSLYEVNLKTKYKSDFWRNERIKAFFSDFAVTPAFFVIILFSNESNVLFLVHIIDGYIYLSLFFLTGLFIIVHDNRKVKAKYFQKKFKFFFLKPCFNNSLSVVLPLLVINVLVCLDYSGLSEIRFGESAERASDYGLILIFKELEILLIFLLFIWIGGSTFKLKEKLHSNLHFYLTKGLRVEDVLFRVNWKHLGMSVLLPFLGSLIYREEISDYPFLLSMIALTFIYWSNFLFTLKYYSTFKMRFALVLFGVLQIVLWFNVNDVYMAISLVSIIVLLSLSFNSWLTEDLKHFYVAPLLLVSIPLFGVALVFLGYYLIAVLWVPLIYVTQKFYLKKITFNRIAL